MSSARRGLAWLGMARRGRVRQVSAGPGPAWLGPARQGVV